MRIRFGNKIIEFDYVCCPGGRDRFIDIISSDRHYIIDCEEINYAKWLMSILITKGFFDASGVDYDNSNDPSWFEYCRNKTEEQKVFGKWINNK